MSRATPAHRERATRLLAHEGAIARAAAPATTAAARVFDKLCEHLAPLVGTAGVHSLFVRSAKLSQGEFASLSQVSVLEGATTLRERLLALDPAVSTEAAVDLFGNFFALLSTFIGERLTTQILWRAWQMNEDAAPRETEP